MTLQAGRQGLRRRAARSWMRTSVSNFFANLEHRRSRSSTSCCRASSRRAGQDTLRFTLNTTLGIGGFFDPASDAGLPRHDEDLGQTLGKWGVPTGTVRDAAAARSVAPARPAVAGMSTDFLEPFYLVRLRQRALVFARA
ncbi:MAG: VacJ family lipoprotein [Chromatiales bacterium]|nr:VacJ family lipoprotein [Chromatiales bacterium]